MPEHPYAVGVGAGVLSFPNPVNEKAARAVAAGVALLTAITLATGAWWMSAVLAVGFLLRVLSGPRFSPLGQLATRVVAPRLGPPVETPGPPKRFAQAIGLTVTTAAAIAWFAAGSATVPAVLLSVLLVFAMLESVAGFCAGCWLFAQLMRAGVIPNPPARPAPTSGPAHESSGQAALTSRRSKPAMPTAISTAAMPQSTASGAIRRSSAGIAGTCSIGESRRVQSGKRSNRPR